MKWKTSMPPREEKILVRAVNDGREFFAVVEIFEEVQCEYTSLVWHVVEGVESDDYVDSFHVSEITHWCEITKPKGIK